MAGAIVCRGVLTDSVDADAGAERDPRCGGRTHGDRRVALVRSGGHDDGDDEHHGEHARCRREHLGVWTDRRRRVDIARRRPEFRRVPPRAFVRGERTGFHECRMVVGKRGQGSVGHRLDSIGTMPEVSGQIESKSDVDWLLLSDDVLPVADAYDWAVQPSCGAVVLFSGTVRNHAEGRDGVESLTYEAYDDQVVARFAEIVAETRRRWPDTGRIAIHHRTGRLELTESSVVTVVSAPHRARGVRSRPVRDRRARRSRRRSGSTRCGSTVPTGEPGRTTSHRRATSPARASRPKVGT